MTPANELLQLEVEVQRARAYNTMTEEECDSLLERMDALWTQLSSGERDVVNKRHARMATIMLHEAPAVHDVLVSKASPIFPRTRAGA